MKKGFIEYPVSRQEAANMGFKVDELNHYGDTYIVCVNADGCKNAEEVQQYLWAEAKKKHRDHMRSQKAKEDFSDEYSEEDEPFREPMASLDYLAEHGYEGCKYIEEGYDTILNNDALYDALRKLQKIKPRYVKYIRAYYFNKDPEYNYEKMSREFGKAIPTLHEQIHRGEAILRDIMEGEV